MVLVFSSIFMGIWNSDQKAMDSTIARNKRLNKPIAVFPMPSVETVQREEMLPIEMTVPEPRPVRLAMRASDDVGQNEPVIERDEQPAPQHTAQGSVVNQTPVPEEPVSEEIESEEPSAAMPAMASIVTEIQTSTTAVDEIESSSVPAPEDFSTKETADSGTVETVLESVTAADVAREEIAVEVVETGAVVTAEVALTVAEDSGEETGADHSGDDAIQNKQSVIEATEAELPEPADPVAVESETSETNEDEKLLEDRLLQSGEYDMLDVHAEDVTPGNVEPAVDGGATCIPLPRNLASGTWQVIHSSGEFFRLTVDRGANSAGKYSDRDEDVLETSFCITTTPDGVRWCFIRSFVDSPAPVRRVTTEFFSPGQQ